MNDIKYLTLDIMSPLQSWGHSSKLDDRHTAPYPTRSGIIGMLCAASGIDREDTEGTSNLNNALTVDVYTTNNYSIMTDYQTVGGGYQKDSQLKSICKRGNGSPNVKSHQRLSLSVVTHRDYIEDSRFCVIVSGRSEVIQQVAEKIQNPVWGIWFGRKCCVPSTQVFVGVYGEEKLAFDAVVRLLGEDQIFSIKSAKTFKEGELTMMDNPISFSSNHRIFSTRRIIMEKCNVV